MAPSETRANDTQARVPIPCRVPFSNHAFTLSPNQSHESRSLGGRQPCAASVRLGVGKCMHKLGFARELAHRHLETTPYLYISLCAIK